MASADLGENIKISDKCKFCECNQMVKSYQTSLRNITSLIHANYDDNIKFLASYDNQIIQKVKIEKVTSRQVQQDPEENFDCVSFGPTFHHRKEKSHPLDYTKVLLKFEQLRSVMVLKQIDIEFEEFGQLENGDLIISSANSELNLYTKTEKLQTYKTFTPLITIGVHVNRENKVLVGLIERMIYTINKDSVRQVVVLNQEGDIQHRFEFDKKNRLFTRPRKMVTFGQNICSEDTLNSSGEGRVVVIDYRGHIQWVYNGHGKDKSKFYPCGLAVTSSDVVMVSDSVHHVIHVLTPKGDIIACHNIKDMGIELPISLALDLSGLLWVGCNSEKRQQLSMSPLHALKLWEDQE